MTRAEQSKMAEKGLTGVRLSCQIDLRRRHDGAGDQPARGQRPAGCRAARRSQPSSRLRSGSEAPRRRSAPANGLGACSRSTSLRSRVKSDSILPAPSTTDDSGSSATCTGRPVSLRMRSSRLLQQRAAAAQRDAAVVDVRGEFRRNALERVAHGLDDEPHRFAEGLADLRVVQRDGRGLALDHVAALDLHLLARRLERAGASQAPS